MAAFRTITNSVATVLRNIPLTYVRYVSIDYFSVSLVGIQKLNIPLFRTASGQRTFCYRAVSLWNDLEPSLKACNSVQNFKHLLKSKLLHNFLS